MRVHHLNCATLRPPGMPALVCHCLLVEAGERLVLVDTGFGLDDVAHGRRPFLDGLRAAPVPTLFAKLATRPAFDPDETALRQVERLGHSPDAVTDIVLTHLDRDHAGGLRDFPRARVHVRADEHAAATEPVSRGERLRYMAEQWSHDPDWMTYDDGGDAWHGLERVRELDGLTGIALVPLPGHTRGHAGVIVDGGERPLLHAGDTYFFRGEVDPVSPSVPRQLAGFQKRLEVDGAARRSSRESVRELGRTHPEVGVFCSHDPVEFERLAAP